MPDMAYSRAYETYEDNTELAQRGINYTAMPVPGTIKRGEVFPFPLPKDKDGDTVNYIASRQVRNPMPMLDSVQRKEAERSYLINCGICHGTALDGNGPLYNGGNGPYPAAPKNLVGDPVVSVMPEGQMFYSVTYGKGLMGPYGSQLTTSQRWEIVHYVKEKQLAARGEAPAGAEQGAGSSGGSQPAGGGAAGGTQSGAGGAAGGTQSGTGATTGSSGTSAGR
jgi:mono/diheme cytochrome c family protein